MTTGGVQRPAKTFAWWAWQGLIVALLAGAVAWFVVTWRQSYSYARFDFEFDFMNAVAGFDIGFHLLPYDRSTSTYWDVFLNGLLNTVLLAALSIATATPLGLLLARALNTKRPLARRMLLASVSTLRGIPLLLLALLVVAILEATVDLRAAGIPSVPLLTTWLILSFYFVVAIADDLRDLPGPRFAICTGYWPQIVKWTGFGVSGATAYPHLTNLILGTTINQTGEVLPLLLLTIPIILSLAWIAWGLGRLLNHLRHLSPPSSERTAPLRDQDREKQSRDAWPSWRATLSLGLLLAISIALRELTRWEIGFVPAVLTTASIWAGATALAIALGTAAARARCSSMPVLRWTTDVVARGLVFMHPLLVAFLLLISMPAINALPLDVFWSFPIALGVLGGALLALQPEKGDIGSLRQARFQVAAGMLRDSILLPLTTGVFETFHLVRSRMTDWRWKGLEIEALLGCAAFYAVLHLLLRRALRPREGGVVSPPYA